ncbi:MAG TPA: hypothetical protein VG895_00535 [Patescibacteria group bacterium]|nr:hypothetical protein [Gammaproteobacteria bacterium]HWA51529.1 hypothetical protein [Patescibacteria group bacterium]
MRKLLWAVGCLSLISINGIAEVSGNYAVCSQPYALCTTATCKPVPGSKSQSVCSCIVQDGASLGTLPCDKRKPTTNSQGQQLLFSNFSFENAKTNWVMTCNSNHPWTDCLDKPCTVDPQNSNQVTCTCEIKYTTSFITFGGQCATASCGTTLYSGATATMLEQGSQALVSAMHLAKSPMQNCPL